jgi:hypothetical protein
MTRATNATCADGFLHPERIRKHLESYRRITQSKGRGWWLSEKVRLYALAEQAFDPDRADLDAFAEIHRTLRGYWQVFRNGTGWTPRRALRVLMSPPCQTCSRTRLDLPTLGQTRDVAALWACLAAFSGIKTLPRGNVSPMAVSKFFHFFNPRLFPIFDRAFVRNRVFPLCRPLIDESKWRWRDQTAPLECDSRYERGLGEYLHYVLWAADSFGGMDTAALMSVFTSQFSAMLEAEGRDTSPPSGLETYFAAAFEFVVIGATKA